MPPMACASFQSAPTKCKAASITLSAIVVNELKKCYLSESMFSNYIIKAFFPALQINRAVAQAEHIKYAVTKL